jgi:hypothetical protein
MASATDSSFRCVCETGVRSASYSHAIDTAINRVSKIGLRHRGFVAEKSSEKTASTAADRYGFRKHPFPEGQNPPDQPESSTEVFGWLSKPPAD